MSARGYWNPETSAEPDGVREGQRNECHVSVIPILNTIHSYLLHNLNDEKMVVGKLMIFPLSILVSRKLNLCDFCWPLVSIKRFILTRNIRIVSKFLEFLPPQETYPTSLYKYPSQPALISLSVIWSFHFAVVTIASIPRLASP